MPEAYQRGTAARFGQRLRAPPAPGRGRGARPEPGDRRRGPPPAPREAGRLRVVPLAARPRLPARGGRRRRARARRGWASAARYVVYAGRYDARQDLPTLLDALARARRGAARRTASAAAAWPPRVCLVGASPDDRAALSRAAARAGVADAIAYAPGLPDDRLAALVAGARFARPAGPLGGLRSRGARGARRRRAGRRERRRGAARDRGRAPGSSWSRATRPAWRRRSGRRGRTTSCTPAWSRRRSSAPHAPADVGGRRARDARDLGRGRAAGAAALGPPTSGRRRRRPG